MAVVMFMLPMAKIWFLKRRVNSKWPDLEERKKSLQYQIECQMVLETQPNILVSKYN